MYTVYRHYNRLTNKSYIGMTSKEPKYRWDNGNGYQRNPKMWSDIRNSDWNKDWQHEILGKFEDKQEALKYESFLIAMLDTVRNGYNSSTYSSYGFTEETKRKISEAKTGEKNHMFGKHHSEESKKKISHSKGVNGIIQYSKDGKFIAEYPSIMEASRQTRCYNGHICECCKGERKSASGFIWKYKEI